MRLLSRSAPAALAVAALLALPVATAAPVASSAPGTSGANPAAAIVAARVPTAPGGGGGGGVATAEVATASTLTVTTTVDDGSTGSLRDVIEHQATSPGGDTVVLAAGATYVLTCAEGGTITHGDSPLEIVGNGATITMDAACEEGLLVNGEGALVIREVQFAGLRLEPTTRITAIVRTDGPLALIGGRVADNVVVAGSEVLDGFFYVTGAGPDAGLLVDGTVFAANDRTDDGDCGLFCAVGDVELRNASFTDTAVDTATGGCGAILCVTGDVGVIDTTITASTNTGTSHCGGLVCIDGDLRFTRSTIARTSSTVTAPGSVCGGLVCTSAGVTLTDSVVLGTVADDSAEQQCGAGLLCGGGDVDLVRSTVSGTRVTLTGSGDGNACGSMVCMRGGLTAVNSTVADNTTTGGADLVGAWTFSEAIGFVYVTFAGNSGSGIPALAPFDADHITFTTFGSVLTGSGAGGTCSAGLTVTSQGYDFADDPSCGLTGPGDVQQVGADPQLGALADNGGPGPTMLPAVSSPLVDAVPAAACAAGQGITVDERSLPRPSSLGPTCDIGAVELQPVPVVEPTFTG